MASKIGTTVFLPLSKDAPVEEPPLKMPPLTISWYRSLSHASYASDNKIMQTGKNISKLASKIGTTVIAPLSKNTL